MKVDTKIYEVFFYDKNKKLKWSIKFEAINIIEAHEIAFSMVNRGQFANCDFVVIENPFDIELIKDNENKISKDINSSYYYAKEVIKGRFKKGEKVISKNAAYSYQYAKDIIKGRFLEAELQISTSYPFPYYYAQNIIKGRFQEYENSIRFLINRDFQLLYLKNIMKFNHE